MSLKQNAFYGNTQKYTENCFQSVSRMTPNRIMLPGKISSQKGFSLQVKQVEVNVKRAEVSKNSEAF